MALLKQPYPKFIMETRIQLAAVKILIKELGLRTAISYIRALFKEKKRLKNTTSSIWDGISPPKDEKDNISREVIEDALILYQLFLNDMDKAKAIKIIKKLIKFSAVAQLSSLIPVLKRKKMLSFSLEEREKIISKIVDQFPNADWEIASNTDDSFSFKITRCRFVELADDIGYPELRDAFCPGDALYFEEYQTDLEFSRPRLIAEGNGCCEFIFKLT